MTTNTKTWKIDSHERVENAQPRTRYELVDGAGNCVTVDHFDSDGHVEVVFGGMRQPYATACAARLAAEAWDYRGDMEMSNAADPREPECDLHVDAAALGDGIVRLYHDPAWIVTVVHFGLEEELF